MTKRTTWIVAALAAFGAAALPAWLAGNSARPYHESFPAGNLSLPKDSPKYNSAPVSIEPQEAYQQVFEETTMLSYSFHVTNTSNRTVDIRRVMPGCGCTDARMDQYALAPQETTQLHVLYSVAELFGELPKREITLVTDDPDHPAARCSVGGYRHRRFQITPPTVDFGTVLLGHGQSCDVSIQTAGPDMRLLAENTIVDCPWLTAEVVRNEALPDGTENLILKIRLRRDTPQGSIQARVFVPRVQNDGIGPLIPVFARVCGPVEFVPPKAFMGILAPDAVATRTIHVRPATLTTPKDSPYGVLVTGLGKAPAGLDATVDEQDPSKVRVTATASKMPLGRFEHELLIKCTVDGTPLEALLTVSGMVGL